MTAAKRLLCSPAVTLAYVEERPMADADTLFRELAQRCYGLRVTALCSRRTAPWAVVAWQLHRGSPWQDVRGVSLLAALTVAHARTRAGGP